MKIIDLTHALTDDISVFNAQEHPTITVAATKERDGFAQKHLSLYSHNGTHMDAPFHVIDDGVTADRMPVTQFFGKAIAIDCRGVDGREIPMEILEKHEDRLSNSDFVLLNTGWDARWKKTSYVEDFPVLTSEAANYLKQFHLKGVGVDAISVDPVESTQIPVHHILLGAEMILIENLTNLHLLGESEFYFSAFPLKIAAADGSPVRAVAIFMGS